MKKIMKRAKPIKKSTYRELKELIEKVTVESREMIDNDTEHKFDWAEEYTEKCKKHKEFRDITYEELQINSTDSELPDIGDSESILDKHTKLNNLKW